jgi:hypothetical protein
VNTTGHPSFVEVLLELFSAMRKEMAAAVSTTTGEMNIIYSLLHAWNWLPLIKNS